MTAPDRSRLCIHTITTKPWPIETAIAKFAAAGVGGITVWRDALGGRDIATVRRWIEEAGLTVVSLCRGGFFPSVDARERAAALDANRRAIDEAAALGAPGVVLVCGADPRQPLEVSRDQIREGIGEIAPYAAARGVSLYVEPLHPMYADSRSAIITLGQALDLCTTVGQANVGIALDVYHVWWDPMLKEGIVRAGDQGSLRAFHVCDWRTPTRDLLLDRALMGEGCIDVPSIRRDAETAGFKGFIEVEIFSTEYWSGDQDLFLDRILAAYDQHT